MLNYAVPLPEGSTIYFPVSAFASAADTKIMITRPTSLPGTVTIIATSVDGSTRTYSIEVYITTGLGFNKQAEIEAVFQNPIRDEISLRITCTQPGPARLFLYGPTGLQVLDRTLGRVNGDHLIYLPGTDCRGLYLYRLIIKNTVLSGKLIRM